MNNHLLKTLAEEIAKFTAPLAAAVESPRSLDRLLAELGARTAETALGDERQTLVAALAAVNNLRAQIDALAAEPSPSLESIDALLDVSDQALAAVRALHGFGVEADAFADLGKGLAAYLLSVYLRAWHPLGYGLTWLATLVQPAHEQEPRPPVVRGDVLVRDSFNVDRFRFGRLPDLVRDPVATLRSEYGSPSADPVGFARKLFPRLHLLLNALGVPCRYGLDPESRESFGEAAPFLEDALIVYVDDLLAGAEAEAGLVLSPSPADRGDLGLVISPFGALSTTKEVGGWSVELGLTGASDVIAYGRHGLTLLADGDTTEVKGSLAATLPAPEQGPAYALGAPDGSRLEVGGAQLKLETALSEARQSLALSADVTSSKLVIAPGDGDGFLRSILPAEGLEAKFDLGLAWSNERGLTFRGSGGLEATLPVNISIGDVLKVPAIHLRLRASDAGLRGEVSANVGLSIGPIDVVVEEIGLETTLTFPEEGGNLGEANLSVGFKPPKGAGLSLAANVVVGGGYLSFDPEKQEYSGILQLEIADKIAVKAIGMLTTRMPGGGEGYSLVAIIFTEGFTPIQLGFGFALTGIGGLLAINRTFDESFLRAGLKNHTLDSLLFPKDPIRNAPQIISNLNRVFPVARGHHLFGPVVQIAWGAPPLITADVALVFEFGARLRMLILAQIAAILPRQDNDLVRLKMDAVGVVDFDQGTAELDATLHDSRLLKKFVLTGDMAMRVKWEGSPNFALAVGGLHPAYNPPRGFPKLERMAINLSSGNNPRLRCESYFALTSNTVQWGARAELYAEAGGLSIHGQIGYDVLIQFDPFSFLAEFHAHLQLKRGSTNLFKVKLEGSLAGPRPLHIKGKATFELLWWDVTIRVDKRLVEGSRPPAPEPVDVLPRLQEALGDVANWTTQLPAGARQMVTLRPVSAGPAGVLLHPLGSLRVKQNVVPLDLEISRFGQGPPSAERLFKITRVRVGTDEPKGEPVKDFFAPGQYFEMSDDEKLTRPSFEQLTAGVAFGAEGVAITREAVDWVEVGAVEYETVIVARQGPEARRSDAEGETEKYKLSVEGLGQQARYGAAANSEVRRTGKARYRGAVGKYKVGKEGWSVVSAETMTVSGPAAMAGAEPTSYTEAAEALRKLKRENPAQAAGLKVLRLSELSQG